MSGDDTGFYHDALDLVPEQVVELARFLRTLSTNQEPEDEIVDDALDQRVWGGGTTEIERWYGPEDASMVEVTVYFLNWFGLARNCPVPGMPAWRWREIVATVKDLWESKTPYDDDDPFAEEPRGRNHWSYKERGEATARLLLQLCAEFIGRYLREPRAIPAERAEELSPRQWEVVILVCNQRLDAPEAAALLGIEPSTARKYLEEAAKALDLTVKELRRRRVGIPVDSCGKIC